MAERSPRLSLPGLRVLRALVAEPGLSGAEMSRSTGERPGTLYPFLARIEKAGWAASEWERVDPREAGRPRRRLYALTPLGRGQAAEALSGLQDAAPLTVAERVATPLLRLLDSRTRLA